MLQKENNNTISKVNIINPLSECMFYNQSKNIYLHILFYKVSLLKDNNNNVS